MAKLGAFFKKKSDNQSDNGDSAPGVSISSAETARVSKVYGSADSSTTVGGNTKNVASGPIVDRDVLLGQYPEYNKWGAELEDVMADRLPDGVSVMKSSGLRGPVIPWLYDAADRERWLANIAQRFGNVMWVAPAPVPPGIYGKVSVKDSHRQIDRLSFDLTDEKPETLVATGAVLYGLAVKRCEYVPKIYQTGDRLRASHTKAIVGHFRHMGQVYAGGWGVVGVTCGRGVLHMDNSRWDIEMIDTQAAGDAWAPDAVARCRVTPKEARGMFVGRHALGDFFEPLVGECGCGNTGTAVSGVEGRVEDVWRLPSAMGGSKTVDVYPMMIERAVQAADDRIREYELALTSRDKANMRLVLPGFDMKMLIENVNMRIQELCEKRGAAAPKISWIWKPPMVRTKRRLVVGFWENTDHHGDVDPRE